MIRNKKIYLGIALLVVALFLIGNISGFAVSSQYWKEAPVILYPGTTTEIYVVLQNMAGEEDITVTGVIIEGSEIATLSDPSNIYTVPVGTRKNVNIRFDVPEDTEIPSNYSIILSFVAGPAGETETLGLGSGIQKTIPVFIVKEPRKPIDLKSSPWLYIILVLIVILIVVITIVLKKKKKKEK